MKQAEARNRARRAGEREVRFMGNGLVKLFSTVDP